MPRNEGRMTIVGQVANAIRLAGWAATSRRDEKTVEDAMALPEFFQGGRVGVVDGAFHERLRRMPLETLENGGLVMGCLGGPAGVGVRKRLQHAMRMSARYMVVTASEGIWDVHPSELGTALCTGFDLLIADDDAEATGKAVAHLEGVLASRDFASMRKKLPGPDPARVVDLRGREQADGTGA